MNSSVSGISLLVLCFCTGAQTTHRTLTLNDVLSIASREAKQMRIIEFEARSQQYQAAIYRSEAFPTVSLTSGASYVSQSLLGLGAQGSSELTSLFNRIDGYAFNWALSGQQPVFPFGKISSALRLSSLSKNVVRDAQQLQKDLFLLDVMTRFTETYLAQFDTDAAQNALARSERALNALRVDHESGRTSMNNLLRVEALAHSDRAQAMQAQSTLRFARNRLSTMIGSDDTSFTVALDQAQAAPPADTQGEYLQIRLKRAQRDVLIEQARTLRAAMYPSVSLVAGITNQFLTIDTSGMTARYMEYLENAPPPDSSGPGGMPLPPNPPLSSFFDPDYISYSVGLQLSWMIYSGNRMRSQYNQAKVNRDRVDRELSLLESENATARAELTSQIAILDSLLVAGTMQLTVSRRLLEKVERDLASGYADALDFLDAEREFRNADRQVASAQTNRVLAVARLRLLSGLPLHTLHRAESNQ